MKTDGYEVVEDPAWFEDVWDRPEYAEQIDSEKPKRNRSFLKWILFSATVVIIAVTLTAGGVGMWVTKQVNPPGDPGTAVSFTVADTDDLVVVSHKLEAQGFITHAGVFQWYVKRQGGIEFVPGYYTMRPMDTMGNLMRVLNTPPARTYTSVTFPEGYTPVSYTHLTLPTSDLV